MKNIEIKKPGRHLIELKKEGEEVEIIGKFFIENKDQLEVEVIIHHQAPRTKATTVLKGVATDQASIKFVGRIIIDPDCGQTSSFLTERILLLSDQARAEAVPDLEIMSDDVKCSHAASISHVDESQIFYLMSRGLNHSQAQDLIVEGFLN